MRIKKAIGIDLGTESVKVVALEVGAGEIKILGTGTALTEGIRKGAVMDPEAVAKSVNTALENLQKFTGTGSDNIHLGTGGVGIGFQKAKGLVAVSRADGEVSKEDVKRAVSASESNLSKTQNREVLHSIPISYKIDNETITQDPVGLSGVKLEAETLFITIFAQHLKSILKTFEEAGVNVENVVSLPLAVSYAILSKHEKEVGVMILDIGSSTTSIILFEENNPFSLEILPVGSGHITNDIAVAFQISLEDAEKLKINYGSVEEAVEIAPRPKKKNPGDDLVYGHYSKKKLSEVINARLSDIFELIEKHLKKTGRAGLLPAGVVITGGGANLPGITEFTRDYLKLPARIAEQQSLEGFHDKIKNPAWAGAVGVALMALGEKNSDGSVRTGGGAFMRWLRAFLP